MKGAAMRGTTRLRTPSGRSKNRFALSKKRSISSPSHVRGRLQLERAASCAQMARPNSAAACGPLAVMSRPSVTTSTL